MSECASTGAGALRALPGRSSDSKSDAPVGLRPIAELLVDQGPLDVDAISKAVELDEVTVQHTVAAMAERGWVTLDGDLVTPTRALREYSATMRERWRANEREQARLARRREDRVPAGEDASVHLLRLIRERPPWPEEELSAIPDSHADSPNPARRVECRRLHGRLAEFFEVHGEYVAESETELFALERRPVPPLIRERADQLSGRHRPIAACHQGWPALELEIQPRSFVETFCACPTMCSCCFVPARWIAKLLARAEGGASLAGAGHLAAARGPSRGIDGRAPPDDLNAPPEQNKALARIKQLATKHPRLPIPRTEIVRAGVPKSTLSGTLPLRAPGRHGGVVPLRDFSKFIAGRVGCRKPRNGNTNDMVCQKILQWVERKLEASQ